jgi:hypothetical protein
MFAEYLNLNLSQKTKNFAYLSIISSVFFSIFDIYLAGELTTIIDSKSFFKIFALLVIRSVMTLTANFFILNFSLSSEVDLKVKALSMGEYSRENFFRLISFNVAHNALTGSLRVIIEVIMITVILIYLVFTNINLVLLLLSFSFFVFLIFFSLLYYSKNIRTIASEEQSKFLSKGSDLVSLSDRSGQLETLAFFKDKLRYYSEKYVSMSVKSLFLSQAPKPLLEPLIFAFGILILQFNNLTGGVLYLFYRIGNGIFLLINIIPLIKHFLSQYYDSLRI